MIPVFTRVVLSTLEQSSESIIDCRLDANEALDANGLLRQSPEYPRRLERSQVSLF